MLNRFSVPGRKICKTSYCGILNDFGVAITPSPYPLEGISFTSLLHGEVSIPSYGSDKPYNGLDLGEVTFYARDVFEGMEAMKASLGVVNKQIDAERSISSE